MQVIFTALVIVFFIIGCGFGFVVGKNGCIQLVVNAPEKEKPLKKTVEQQLDEMMNYNGSMVRGE